MKTKLVDSSQRYSPMGEDGLAEPTDNSDWQSAYRSSLSTSPSVWTDERRRPINSYCQFEEMRPSNYLKTNASNNCVNTRTAADCNDYRPPSSANYYWNSIPKNAFESDAKRLSEAAETCGSLVIGAVCSKKFSYEIFEPPQKTLTLAEKSEARNLGTAHAFSSLLAASATEYAIDSLVDPNGRKAGFTVTADWLFAPVLAVYRMPWLAKYALMLVLHALGRCLDDNLNKWLGLPSSRTS